MTNRGELDDRLRDLTDLIDDLIQLIEAENQELQTGVPTALSRATRRKAHLGAELDGWVRQVRTGDFDLSLASPSVRQEMAQRAGVLDVAMKENMDRLRAGIDATRLRVDAIMRAIREQTAKDGSYDAHGRRARSLPAPSSFLI